MQRILLIISLLITMLSMSACTSPKKVNTENSQLLIKQLESIESITQTKCMYIRPSFVCKISVDKTFTEDILTQIVDIGKIYITEDEMRIVSQKYGSHLGVREAYFYIYEGSIDTNHKYIITFYRSNINEDELPFSHWIIEEISDSHSQIISDSSSSN